MADFGSVDGRAEAPGDGAGRLSASELRPVDAAGRERPETVEEGLMADLDVVEREARESREEAARLRARVAALEGAARRAVDAFPKPKYAKPEDADQGGSSADLDVAYAAADQFGWDATAALRDALRGGTSALDAVVSAAVAAERARIRARVEALARMEAVARHDMQICDAGDHDHGYWHADDVLSAIGAIGGAP